MNDVSKLHRQIEADKKQLILINNDSLGAHFEHLLSFPLSRHYYLFIIFVTGFSPHLALDFFSRPLLYLNSTYVRPTETLRDVLGRDDKFSSTYVILSTTLGK